LTHGGQAVGRVQGYLAIDPDSDPYTRNLNRPKVTKKRMTTL
jgi:hypothetical protein